MVDNNTEKKSKKSTTRRTDSKTNNGVLVDIQIDTKIKLALLWVALMFFYVYNDILSFFQPGTIEQLSTGTIEGMEMTQAFLFGGALLMSLPIIMIILSASLPAGSNRKVNIGVGVFHFIILSIPLLAPGEIWAYYAFNMMAEGVIIALIIWTAVTWPVLEQHRGEGQ